MRVVCECLSSPFPQGLPGREGKDKASFHLGVPWDPRGGADLREGILCLHKVPLAAGAGDWGVSCGSILCPPEILHKSLAGPQVEYIHEYIKEQNTQSVQNSLTEYKMG